MKAFRALVGLACALLFAGAAIAQQIPDQAYGPDGVRKPTGAFVQISKDTLTGLPCVVGFTDTCPGGAGSGGGGGVSSLSPFAVSGNTTLNVTTTSANVALPSAGTVVVVKNLGAAVEYVVLGVGSGTTATTAGTPLQPGEWGAFAQGSNTYLAAITAAGTTTNSVITGVGQPLFGNVFDNTTPVPVSQSGSWTAATKGTIASGSAASDPPVEQGCRGSNTTPTAVADGQVVHRRCSLLGDSVVALGAPPEMLVQGLTAAMTGTTSTAVTGMGAPGSGLRNYITNITCGNSHASVGTFVELQDGSGGTTFWTIPAAANYGGAVIPLSVPLRQPTANTALFVKDTTTGANVICSAAGFKAP